MRGHANHLAERAGEDPAGARNAWVARLVCARPALGSARHVGWYGALDDDLAALRATLQHTLVEAPSATGVAVAARLAVYWGFRGMAREGERWMRTAVDACAADPELGRRAERAAVHVDLGTCWTVQGRPAEGREQIRAGIAEGAGLAGDDAVLLCGALVVAAGSAALDVAVRHIELVHATITAPGPELVAQYAALHHDARGEDNLYTAWLAAANAARLLLARGRPADALTWARSAVRNSVEAGRGTRASALLTAMTARLGRAAAERAREEGARATLADLADA